MKHEGVVEYTDFEQRPFFLPQLFPFYFISRVRIPTLKMTRGDIKSDIFLVEGAGLRWCKATDSAARLETSRVALIAWEWTEKPAGAIIRLLKGWGGKISNLWLLIRKTVSLHLMKWRVIRRCGKEMCMYRGGGGERSQGDRGGAFFFWVVPRIVSLMLLPFMWWCMGGFCISSVAVLLDAHKGYKTSCSCSAYFLQVAQVTKLKPWLLPLPVGDAHRHVNICSSAAVCFLASVLIHYM